MCECVCVCVCVCVFASAKAFDARLKPLEDAPRFKNGDVDRREPGVGQDDVGSSTSSVGRTSNSNACKTKSSPSKVNMNICKEFLFCSVNINIYRPSQSRCKHPCPQVKSK